MSTLRYIVTNVVESLLRLFPFPCRTGIVEIGSPGRDAPVLLTCNFHLTVARVKRALRGMDCYLLIANSRGINVWCASAGGLFTHHDAISALKTSGIEDLVDHRRVILPQLAAAGIESRRVQQKTGWRVVWGPVYARDVPAFVAAGLEKTPHMRAVEFPWTDRLEAAASLAFPLSIVVALAALLLWPEALVPLVLVTWGAGLAMLLSFPLYRRLIGSQGLHLGPISLSFERGGLQLVFWLLSMLGLAAYVTLAGGAFQERALWWSAASLLIIVVLSIDLRGFTPSHKGSFLDEEPLRVTLDQARCRGTGFCVQVCPRNCFEMDTQRRLARMPRPDGCIQCGACIVQCPFDALWFETAGGIIPPQMTRRFKMNLAGKRIARVGE